MQYTYTAIISQNDVTFYAKVPDIDSCITTGNSLQEAILRITDALNLCITVWRTKALFLSSPRRRQIFHI